MKSHYLSLFLLNSRTLSSSSSFALVRFIYISTFFYFFFTFHRPVVYEYNIYGSPNPMHCVPFHSLLNQQPTQSSRRLRSAVSPYPLNSAMWHDCWFFVITIHTRTASPLFLRVLFVGPYVFIYIYVQFFGFFFFFTCDFVPSIFDISSIGSIVISVGRNKAIRPGRMRRRKKNENGPGCRVSSGNDRNRKNIQVPVRAAQ